MLVLRVKTKHTHTASLNLKLQLKICILCVLITQSTLRLHKMLFYLTTTK